MSLKHKRWGYGLKFQTIKGVNGDTYLFIKTPKGSYHAFVEVETKEALRECGINEDNKHYTTRQMAKKLLGF